MKSEKIKRTLISAVATLLLMGSGTVAAVPIDMSQAVITATGPNSFHMDNVLVNGSPYSADFSWNSANNVFVPTNYGPMPVADIVGTWALDRYWLCNPLPPEQLTIDFWPDGTVSNSIGDTGNYIVNGNTVDWNEGLPPYITYTGTFQSPTAMGGTMLDNSSAINGCWNATKIDNIPGP